MEFTDIAGKHWKYDESAPLGKGGYGTVFRGHDEQGHPVAVKVIASEGKPISRKLDHRELEIIERVWNSGLATDHLLVALGIMQDNDYTFIAMPLAETVLADHMHSSELPLADKLAILREIAVGLEQLAAIGIVHRDLKPLNVLRVDRRWHLSDFGTSRDLQQSTSTYTFKGGGGSYEYTAPEIFDNLTPTPRSDLYSFGVLAYELLTGQVPFTGEAHEIAEQHRHSMVPSLPTSLPPRLHSIVLRLLAKNPNERYADARAVGAALDGLAVPLTEDQTAFAHTVVAARRRENIRKESEAIRQRAEQAIHNVRVRAAADLREIIDVTYNDVNASTAGQTRWLGPEHEPLDTNRRMGFVYDDYVLQARLWKPITPPTNATDDFPLLWGGLYLYEYGADHGANNPAPSANLLYLPSAPNAATHSTWSLRRWDIEGRDGQAGLDEADIRSKLNAYHSSVIAMNRFVVHDEVLDAARLFALFHQFIQTAIA
ncbi:serine/threonine-protein kinase [Nocardia sp. NPDC058114]|uniref:serine/threonine-protein kinase n=1 Tax=Nocardia sp. NPDC058114 TaxID=3346346 RepID=UPI0036DC6A9B